MAAQPTWSASTHPWIPWIFYRCQGYRQVILAVLGCFYMLATSTGKQFGQMKGNPRQRQHCFGLPHLQKTGWRGELPRNLKAKKTRTLRIVTTIDSHILNTHRLLIFIRRWYQFSLLSWRNSCVRGAFLAAEPRRKIPPATFLMSFECCPLLSAWLEPFDYPIRKSGVNDLQTNQAKRNNHCKLFSTQTGYSAVTPNLRN